MLGSEFGVEWPLERTVLKETRELLWDISACCSGGDPLVSPRASFYLAAEAEQQPELIRSR